MLGYPDKTNGTRDNWMSVKTDIMEDLEEILNLKDWKIQIGIGEPVQGILGLCIL